MGIYFKNIIIIQNCIASVKNSRRVKFCYMKFYKNAKNFDIKDFKNCVVFQKILNHFKYALTKTFKFTL